MPVYLHVRACDLSGDLDGVLGRLSSGSPRCCFGDGIEPVERIKPMEPMEPMELARVPRAPGVGPGEGERPGVCGRLGARAGDLRRRP